MMILSKNSPLTGPTRRAMLSMLRHYDKAYLSPKTYAIILSTFTQFIEKDPPEYSPEITENIGN